MAEKVCEECGQELEFENESNPWYECVGCGTYHCPDCLREHMEMENDNKGADAQEEEMKLDNAEAKNDLETNERKICPDCEEELNKLN